MTLNNIHTLTKHPRFEGLWNMRKHQGRGHTIDQQYSDETLNHIALVILTREGAPEVDAKTIVRLMYPEAYDVQIQQFWFVYGLKRGGPAIGQAKSRSEAWEQARQVVIETLKADQNMCIAWNGA